jgi:hypothetical protein
VSHWDARVEFVVAWTSDRLFGKPEESVSVVSGSECGADGHAHDIVMRSAMDARYP